MLGDDGSSLSDDVLQYHQALLSRVSARRQARSSVIEPSRHATSTASAASTSRARDAPEDEELVDLTPVPPTKRAKVEAYHPCYSWAEETIRNDLPARYAVTGEWSGNFIAGAEEDKRFDEYPRSKKLLRLKKELLARYAHPPLYLTLVPLLPGTDDAAPSTSSAAPALSVSGASPSALHSSTRSPMPDTALSRAPHSDVPASVRPLNAALLSTLGQIRFDTILITPPAHLSWEEIAGLPIRQLSADPSFLYLWVGEGGQGGLEKGREAMARWGFRRCEEIVWVKTNRAASKRGPGTDAPTDSIFQNTKQHCLMGIRGTVRRAIDGWLVHTNIDTDIIVWEGDKLDPHSKPPELYSLAENFSMGSRRLDLFGARSRPRAGWVTAGWEEDDSSPVAEQGNAVDRLEGMVLEGQERGAWGEFEKDAFEKLALIQGRYFYPTPPDIESLRPKSPVRNGFGPSRPHSSQSQGGGSTGGPGRSSVPPTAYSPHDVPYNPHASASLPPAPPMSMRPLGFGGQLQGAPMGMRPIVGQMQAAPGDGVPMMGYGVGNAQGFGMGGMGGFGLPGGIMGSFGGMGMQGAFGIGQGMYPFRPPQAYGLQQQQQQQQHQQQPGMMMPSSGYFQYPSSGGGGGFTGGQPDGGSNQQR